MIDPRPAVTVIYRFLPHYRVEFFDGLRKRLDDGGIRLEVIYGKNQAPSKQDERDLAWATAVNNVRVRVGPLQLYWQPLPSSLYTSELVILMQESKIVSNFAVLLYSFLRHQKVAFWGHGVNFQDNSANLTNRFKHFYSSRVDWWFAYTNRVAELVCRTGFPRSRITVVQNAIDTRSLVEEFARTSVEQLEAIKLHLGCTAGPVALYCGSMYKEKRLDFLLQGCLRLRATVPGFQVIFIGAGPEANLMQQFTTAHGWAHYVGPKFGAERVPYFKIADAVLMPGGVGLGVLDCFAMETPIVTTRSPSHGPEFDYIENGYNGVVTENSLENFVEGARSVLVSDELRGRLRQGCRNAAAKYTLEAMVGNFVEGVRRALDRPRRAEERMSPSPHKREPWVRL